MKILLVEDERPLASAVIAVFIVLCILVLPQRAGVHPSAARG